MTSQDELQLHPAVSVLGIFTPWTIGVIAIVHWAWGLVF